MRRLATIEDLELPQVIVDDFFDQATMISQLYDDFTESDEDDGHLRAPGIHASEISGCARKVYYSMTSAPKYGAKKKKWRQRFEFGKLVHIQIQNDFYKMAAKSKGRIQFQAEVPIGPKFQEIAEKLHLYSSADGIISFRDDFLGPVVLRIGLEIKTKSPKEYEKLKEPDPEHIEQCHVYMKALDLPLMYIMYINKGNQYNTSSLPPFLIRFDPAIWNKLETKCNKILMMVAANEIPDREEGILCEFCPYGRICEPEYLKRNTQGGGSAQWKRMRNL